MTFTPSLSSSWLFSAFQRLLPKFWLFTLGGLLGLWMTDTSQFAAHLAADEGWWVALFAAAVLIPACYSGFPHLFDNSHVGLLLIATALVVGLTKVVAFQANTWIHGAILMLSALLIGLLVTQAVSLLMASTEDRFVVPKIMQGFFLMYTGGVLQLAFFVIYPTTAETKSLSMTHLTMPLLAFLCGMAWHVLGKAEVRHPSLLASGKRKYLWRNNVWRNSLVAALFLGIGLGALWEAAPMLVHHYEAIGAVLAKNLEGWASAPPSTDLPERADVAMIGSMLAVAILIAGVAVRWTLRRWRSRPIFNALTAFALITLMLAAFTDGLPGFAGFVTGCTLFVLLIPFTVAYSLRYLSANVPLAASLWLAIAIIGYTSGTAITTAQVFVLADPGLALLLPALCITVLMWFAADGSKFRSVI